jgi:hypothetical protein
MNTLEGRKTVQVVLMRAEDVKVGDVERHVTGQGRLRQWARVTRIVPDRAVPAFMCFEYEDGSSLGAGVRKLDTVEVQVLV